MTDKKKRLIMGYQGAGIGFLADRLERLFARIETPEDIALHNDIAKEIATMVANEKLYIKQEERFLRDVATIILYCERPKKRWLFDIAGKVLEFGMKGQDG